MKILARYIHGSQDSIDCDVVYIVDEMPTAQDCAAFCSADPSENRNLAVVRNGIVEQCFKGFPDEVNNALLATYPLHAQRDALLISHAVERDTLLKQLSVLRKLVMEFRGTELARESRKALKNGFAERLKFAETADLRTVRWELPEPGQMEAKKRIAFQIGQVLALEEGAELYTKQAIAEYMPALKPYLYRLPCGTDDLNRVKDRFLSGLHTLNIKDLGNSAIICGDGHCSRRISIRGKEHDEDA